MAFDWDNMWDEEVQEGGTPSNIFDWFMGDDVNIYDSESIASGLMERYDMEGLTAGMFPAMSKDLMEATKASTYDAYKRMLTSPETRKYTGEIRKSAGILNPNKKRQRALRAYRAGMSDINQDIFARTSAASGRVRDWMKNALDKVFRMKY